MDGNRDVAAEVREAVAEAARSQGAAGVSSAIQVTILILLRTCKFMCFIEYDEIDWECLA